MKHALPFFMFLLIFSTTALAQEISLNIDGSCKEYNVTLNVAGIEGCYDIKIELTSPDGKTGEIFDILKGWKSSFFFIDEAICVNESTSKTFAMRTESSSGKINFMARLRPVGEAEAAWESGYYFFTQKCPAKPDDTMFVMLVALIVIAVLLAAIALYIKIKPVKKRKKKGLIHI